MTTIDIENLLREAVQQGVANADANLLRELALRLSRTGEVPHLSRLPPDLWADAGYLVETLIRQRASSVEHRMNVLTVLRTYKRKLPIPPIAADALAAEWGATGSLISRLDHLRYYE